MNREHYLTLIRRINRIKDELVSFPIPGEIRAKCRPNNRLAYIDTPVFDAQERMAMELMPKEARMLDNFCELTDTFIEACGTEVTQ